MASTPADEAALPALPPIKTESLTPSPSASAALESAEGTKAAAAVAQKEEKDEEPSTPTSEESRLRPPTECPPAPRKPPVAQLSSAKRKSRPSPTSMRVCVVVPRDLSTVFRSMPMPPEKRIRAS